MKIDSEATDPTAPTNQFRDCLNSLTNMFPRDEEVKMNQLGTDRATAFGPALLVANQFILRRMRRPGHSDGDLRALKLLSSGLAVAAVYNLPPWEA
mgnify:CR=1 FL=1